MHITRSQLYWICHVTGDKFFIIKGYSPVPGYAGFKRWWIDLVDTSIWQHSGEKAAFTNWGPGQPDSKIGDLMCTHLRSPSNQWNDVLCSRKYDYICEKNS